MPENNSLSKVYGLIEDLFLDPSRNETVKSLVTTLMEALSGEVASNTFNIKKIDPTSADYAASFELQDHTGARCGDVINIFKDQHLKGVNYNPETKDLEFVFILQDGSEGPVNVPLDDLFVPYVQGSGILFTKQEDGSIQISLDPSVLSGYLTKEEATELYQPKGDYQPAGNYAPAASEEDPYAHRSEIPNMSPYLTKSSAQETYQPKGDYAPAAPADNPYARQSDIPKPQDLSPYLTKATAQETYQPKGNYLTQIPEEYIPVTEVDSKKVLALPEETQIMGTIAGALYALLSLRIYNKGQEDEITQAEVGTISHHTNINSKDRVSVDLPEGKKYLPFLDEVIQKEVVDGKEVYTLPENAQIMGKLEEALYALLSLRKYEDGTTQVEVGTTGQHMNLNTSDNLTYDTPEGKKTVATTDEIPAVDAGAVRIPVRTIADKVYTKAEIMNWFGINDETSEDSVVELKRLFAYGPQLYIDWGISLSGRPMRYKMPIQYSAFESDNQVKLVVVGLNTSDDSVSKYTILINLDGTIIEGNSNVQVTLKTIEITE